MSKSKRCNDLWMNRGNGPIRRARASFATSAMHFDWLRSRPDGQKAVHKQGCDPGVHVSGGLPVREHRDGIRIRLSLPQPAKGVVEYLSLVRAQRLSLSPPECVNPRSNFYTRVLIATLGPLIVIVVGICLFRAYNSYHNRRNETPRCGLTCSRFSSLCSRAFRPWYARALCARRSRAKARCWSSSRHCFASSSMAKCQRFADGGRRIPPS